MPDSLPLLNRRCTTASVVPTKRPSCLDDMRHEGQRSALHHIEQVREYGICKVIPPRSWRGPSTPQPSPSSFMVPDPILQHVSGRMATNTLSSPAHSTQPSAAVTCTPELPNGPAVREHAHESEHGLHGLAGSSGVFQVQNELLPECSLGHFERKARAYSKRDGIAGHGSSFAHARARNPPLTSARGCRSAHGRARCSLVEATTTKERMLERMLASKKPLVVRSTCLTFCFRRCAAHRCDEARLSARFWEDILSAKCKVRHFPSALSTSPCFATVKSVME